MNNLIGFYTLAYRETKRVFRIWKQTLVPPMLTTMLYFLIFGKIIGSRIGDMQGVSYMAYITPGLIMMNVITASFGNTVSSFYLAKYSKSIEEILVSPLSSHSIILGYVIGSLARALSSSVLVLAVAMFFVDLPITSIFAIITSLILTISLFAIAGIINAIFARSFDEINIVPIFVLTPLTYLGGVFYSISDLPSFWQIVSYFNPVVYMISGFRYGFLGQTNINIPATFVVLSLFVALAYYIAFRLLEQGRGLKS